MSSLEGTLSSTAVSKIAQIILSKNPASTWLISDGENEKVVYFSTGGIRLYTSPGRQVADLESLLVKRQIVPPETLDVARQQVRQSRQEDLAAVLERMEYLPRERFHQLTAELIFLELCDLVTWENAIFEFYQGNPPPEIFDEDHPALFAGLDVKELAERIKNWNQEWSKLKSRLYSERLCPQLAVGPAWVAETTEIGTEEKRIYKLIDGKRTLREISRTTGLDFPNVARIIQTGMENGWLTGTLVPQKKAETQIEVLDEVERLEEALDRAINTILIHKRIANNYERLGQKDRASEHYESIGNIHTTHGEVERAVESYRHAVNVSPENIRAHESLITRLQDGGQESKALDELVSLAKKFLNFGFLHRACDTLRAVVPKIPERFDVRTLFADALVKIGKVQEAVAEYLGIAAEKARLGAVEGIEELYLKVLALDPVNKEAREGLTHEKKRQAGKRAIWLHRLSAAAAVLLLAGWVSIEALSRAAWAETSSVVADAVESREPRRALQTLRTFNNSYPGSLVSDRLVGLEKKVFHETYEKLEADLEEASRLRSEGWGSQAHDLYRKVEGAALIESQVERGRKGAEEAEKYVRHWTEIRQRASRLVDAERYEPAFRLCREIADNFREGAEGLRMPFLIRSSPAGATIFVDNIPRGVTPQWITVRFGRGQAVYVQKLGFAGKTVEGLEDRMSPVVQIDLTR